MQHMEKSSDMCQLDCDPSLPGQEKTFRKSIDNNEEEDIGIPGIISWYMPGKGDDIHSLTTTNTGTQEMRLLGLALSLLI